MRLLTLALCALTLVTCTARHAWPGQTCATEHHQGGPATLALQGGDLVAADMPRQQWALLVSSPFPAPQPAPFGEGFLCLHNLHLTRVTAFDTGPGARTLEPVGEGYYQVVFRDCDRWEPAELCGAARYNVTNVVHLAQPAP